MPPAVPHTLVGPSGAAPEHTMPLLDELLLDVLGHPLVLLDVVPLDAVVPLDELLLDEVVAPPPVPDEELAVVPPIPPPLDEVVAAPPEPDEELVAALPVVPLVPEDEVVVPPVPVEPGPPPALEHAASVAAVMPAPIHPVALRSLCAMSVVDGTPPVL
jgi:hypothetical protein